MKFVVGDVPKTRNKQDKQSPPESAQASAEEDGAGSDLEQEVIDEDLHTEIVADRVFSRGQCPNHIPTQPRASRVRLCTSCVSSGPIQRHTTPGIQGWFLRGGYFCDLSAAAQHEPACIQALVAAKLLRKRERDATRARRIIDHWKDLAREKGEQYGVAVRELCYEPTTNKARRGEDFKDAHEGLGCPFSVFPYPSRAEQSTTFARCNSTLDHVGPNTSLFRTGRMHDTK